MFKVDRIHPGPFITVTREYGVGAIEIRLYRNYLIHSPRIAQGIQIQDAADEEILDYAKRLLNSA